MTKNNIILIGMMGTLKSSAGKILARRLGMRFVDIDDLIIFEYGMSINQIFEDYGEPFFRELEAKIVRIVSGYENVVISTGGGVILREENMRNLISSGYIVMLYSDANSIYDRIKDTTTRPLLKGGSALTGIKRILKERDAEYRKYADITVDNSNLTSELTVEEIEKKLAEYFEHFED